MYHLQRFIQVMFSIYCFAVFIILLFVVFPFVVIASFFGEKGGNMIYVICILWAHVAMFFWGIHHKNYYEAPHFGSHPVVFVFNHISYLDIPILLIAFQGQHFRVLGKAEISKVPVFGFVYRKAAVLVDRGSNAARARSVSILKAILKKNISVVIAPEGTFNLTGKPLKEFYDGAFRIAIETQTPIKPVLFLDAFKRLSYKSIFSFSPGKSRAVFLKEVSVEGLTQNDMPELKRMVYQQMQESLIKYKASWING
ncbi:MAG: lysophospholipid acyltransferase family protein [Ferruginibacter sp.]